MSFDQKYQIASEDAMDRFSREIEKQLSGYTAEGLSEDMDESLTLVKESMEKYVPEDTEATKKSWFQYTKVEPGQLIGVFGHDQQGQLEYVPFIYLGLDMEGNAISFRKSGSRPFWLEPAVQENLGAITRKLSKKEGN